MKTRVLFVDDEPNVLAGLRRMLRDQRRAWDMKFANGGAEALELMETNDFDVVVTDMRMPGIDGAELLNRVAEIHPNTVRLVLSGQSEHERIFRAIGPAHQFLSKPCDPQVLVNTVNRACSLKDQLTNDDLKNLVSQLTELPSLPMAYGELVDELESDEASIERVSDKIESDIGMTARVLQLVNSSFFGIPQHVDSPKHAVSLLGLDIIRPLVLSAHVFSTFENVDDSSFSLKALVDHSLAVATTAKLVAESQSAGAAVVNDAFISGLMHDAGKLILAANLPDAYRESRELAKSNGLKICQAERRVFSASHAEVGGHLLGLWGLPNPIVEAVIFHHRPVDAGVASFTPLTAVHIADVVMQVNEPAEEVASPYTLDEDYLQVLDLPTDLESWQALIAESEPHREESSI